MSTINVSRTRRAVKRRAAASEAMLEANEIHGDLGTPCSMFATGDDLPLFSGTPINVQVETFKDEAHDTQTKLAACPICFDTGTVRVNGKTHKCFCGIADQADVRAALLTDESKRLARVKRNAPQAYPEQHSDTDQVLKEAATVEPISERFATAGAGALSLVDLLTLLLGEQTPVLASRVIAQFKTLSHLYHASLAELTAIKGMTPRKAGVLQCALELASRRLNAPAADDPPTIKCPADAAEMFGAEMRGLDHEEMRVMLLNTKNRVQRITIAYRGSVHTTVIRVSELFKEAIRSNAAAIIVCHNHPSGDPTPSPEDAACTKEIVQAGKLLDIEVLDHLVIGDGQRFVSLKERGLGF